MSDLHVAILAAGKGTRMKSAAPKVLHRIAGLSIIEHVVRTAASLGAVETVVVVGHGADEVRASLAHHPKLKFVVQSPQLGTGHAVQQAEPVLKDKRGTLLVLYGDVPLLTAGTLGRLVDHHRGSQAAATVLTAEVADPYGYGRIVRDQAGKLLRIVEERDASAEERAVSEINSGIYALSLAPLFGGLRELSSDNAQGEYYLTDLIGIYHRQDRALETVRIDDPRELQGVNTRLDLAELGEALWARKRRQLMVAGVTLEQPASAYIDEDVTIGADTVVSPNVTLSGRTTIGGRCRIHSGVRITDSTIGDGVTVLDHCVIVSSSIAAGASVGPFTNVRAGTAIAEQAHAGAFVELKNTQFGARSKAGHLAYLGDAVVGSDVNVGAGAITVKFDGEKKQQTVIEDGAFVGSDSQLVAPVTIGRGAFVAAGSSITEDVPPDALAVGRARQVVKPDWAKNRKKK